MKKLANLIPNLIKLILGKANRIAIIQGVYIFFEFTAIVLFTVILLFGLAEFCLSVYHFFKPEEALSKYNFTDFIKGLLNSLEIFFLSPIPLLIVASFKRIIIKMYPLDVKVHPIVTKDMINEADAKKTFISSIIGVTATFILGQFINLLSNDDARKVSSNLFTVLILTILFLVILIYLYYLVSHKLKDNE